MKKFLICLFFLGGTLCAYPHHSTELNSPLRTLYKLEETRQLLNQVENAGGVTIKAAKLGVSASNAIWLPDERTICINLSKKRSQASLICSLVFELQNALNQKQFDHLDLLAMQGRITKTKYIEAVEHLEYTNALKTVEILKRGVDQHVFPSDTHWPI